MKRSLLKNYRKILGSIFLPVFLSMLVPTISTAATMNQQFVTFQMKKPSDLLAVEKKYSLSPKFLFADTYRAKVDLATESAMKKDERFVYVEQDLPVSALAIATSDPFFSNDPTASDKQWYLTKTHIVDAWSFAKGSNTVTVAVIDTGIHASHVELNDGRIVAGYNTISNQTIAANSDSDDNGHGTAVAGIIGAIPNNSVGISGVDWYVRIMPVKALAADGSGDLSAVAAGIVWAADHGANIINLSLGGSGFSISQTLANAISYAYNHGSLIVAAAGNDLSANGQNLDTQPVYPVCADNGQNMILGVAATDINDQKAAFSDYGANCIDISAPGKKIITTSYLPSDPSDNILIYGSGTSLAAPIVSGVAALIKSTNINLSNVDIRNMIMHSADNISSLNQTQCSGGSCNGFLGSGRLNAQAAIAPKPIANNSLVRQSGTSSVYQISNNTKRLVSNFVLQQRQFDPSLITDEINNQLSFFLLGPALPPLDGTMIKSAEDSQVYLVEGGLKHPLTYLVFISRGLSFSNVKTLASAEVAGYASGEWAQPPEGTLVLVKGDPTVYVMNSGVRRSVTYFVFTQRHLSFARVISVTADEFSHIAAPSDNYWLAPQDGTLIKSSADPGIYVIQNGTKQLLSYNAFITHNYSFGQVKILSPAEIDVIAPGPAVL